MVKRLQNSQAGPGGTITPTAADIVEEKETDVIQLDNSSSPSATHSSSSGPGQTATSGAYGPTAPTTARPRALGDPYTIVRPLDRIHGKTSPQDMNVAADPSLFRETSAEADQT
eukprot:2929716-Karenia_brevis.AAC.1